MDKSKDMLVGEFLYAVQETLLRNKSLLDQLTKQQDASGRLSRAVVKAATHCGCIKIQATKQEYPDDASYDELKKLVKTHIEGKLCNDCQDAVEKEIGKNLYYLAALCDTLELDLYDILHKELDRTNTLGKFSLT